MSSDQRPAPAGRATPADHAAAAELATEAGRLLLELRSTATGDELKDLGDRRSHELLMAALAERYPGDAVLSEEGVDDPVRLGAERVWIVDPLDGTREYGEPPRHDWAVHVALWAAPAGDPAAPASSAGGVPSLAAAVSATGTPGTRASSADRAPGRGENIGALIAGAVALPVLGRTLCSAPPEPIPARADGPLRIAVSRSRPPALASGLADTLGGELVPMGSAGYKAAALLLGEADVYAHAGGQWEWDSAAPVAVAQAAGLHASRLDGSPLLYNQPHPYLPDLVICRPELAEAVLAALGTLVPYETRS